MNRLKNFFTGGNKNESKDKEETKNLSTSENTSQTNENTATHSSNSNNNSNTATTNTNFKNFLNRNVIEHHPGLQKQSDTNTNTNIVSNNNNNNNNDNNNNFNTNTTTTIDDNGGITTTTTTTGIKDDGKTVIRAELEEHCENGVVTETIDVISMTLPTNSNGSINSANVENSEIDVNGTKNKLENLLEKKKDRDSLIEQGILEAQPHKKELERSMAGDKVEQTLRRRHSKEELTQSGVLKGGLQNAKHALEQEIIKDVLNHKLAERPTPQELQSHHILETQESLAEKKQRRASAAELMTEHIQKFKDQESS